MFKEIIGEMKLVKEDNIMNQILFLSNLELVKASTFKLGTSKLRHKNPGRLKLRKI